jgi:hypothetical protein
MGGGADLHHVMDRQDAAHILNELTVGDPALEL